MDKHWLVMGLHGGELIRLIQKANPNKPGSFYAPISTLSHIDPEYVDILT